MVQIVHALIKGIYCYSIIGYGSSLSPSAIALLNCGLLSRRSWVQIPPGPPGVDYEEHVLRHTTVTLRLLPKTKTMLKPLVGVYFRGQTF